MLFRPLWFQTAVLTADCGLNAFFDYISSGFFITNKALNTFWLFL